MNVAMQLILNTLKQNNYKLFMIHIYDKNEIARHTLFHKGDSLCGQKEQNETHWCLMGNKYDKSLTIVSFKNGCSIILRVFLKYYIFRSSI